MSNIADQPGSPPSAVESKQKSSPARSWGRKIFLVAAAVGAALLIWHLMSSDEAKTVGPATGAAVVPTAHLGVRITDVLDGMPKASVPERSTGRDGKVLWTSRFELSASERGVIIMKVDPAALEYTSIEIPLHAGDTYLLTRAKGIAKHFLVNVAGPDFDSSSWFDAGINGVIAHDDKAHTAKTDRASIKMSGVGTGSNTRLRIEAASNHGGPWADW